jgi:hypothetical protein
MSYICNAMHQIYPMADGANTLRFCKYILYIVCSEKVNDFHCLCPRAYYRHRVFKLEQRPLRWRFAFVGNYECRVYEPWSGDRKLPRKLPSVLLSTAFHARRLSSATNTHLVFAAVRLLHGRVKPVSACAKSTYRLHSSSVCGEVDNNNIDTCRNRKGL